MRVCKSNVEKCCLNILLPWRWRQTPLMFLLFNGSKNKSPCRRICFFQGLLFPGRGKSKRCSLGVCSLPSCTRTLKLKGPDMEAIPCLAWILEAKLKISRPLLSALSVFPSFLFSSQIDFCTCKCGKEHHRTNSGSLPVEE